ncbi:diguanylate cyclase [Wenzhouxiangella sediminis]|uniref:diguanylate cyclase n=1 Tax=Wenzhouxiangella sediminis TaxID=1792836 RepID=A0A3E1K819_9GAMM|nr:diguanylate cyclase [Wenzhouxiangella sediminis]
MLAGAALCSLLALVGVRAEEMTTEQFGEKLDRARELNVSAPWQESQELLDELAQHLPQATRDQKIDYWLLVSRNQALAGEIESGLATLRELLAGPMRAVQRARAYRRAANLTMIARKWEETFEYIIRGLELRDRLEGDEEIYAPFSLAAYLYALVGEHETAIEYGHASVDNARAHGTVRDRCVVHGRLAFVYKSAGQYETALEHYREAVSICLESGDDLFTGTIQSGFADLLRHAGEYDRAKAAFAQAFERLEAADYGPGLAEASLYKARLLEETGRLDRMRELLEDTLPRLQDQEVWDYVAEAREMLARAAAARGEFRNAVEHMEQSLDAHRRLLDQNRARQLAYLQVVFDTRTQQQELALLREQRRAAELKAASRSTDRRIRWLASGAAVLALIALLLVLTHVLRGRQHFRRLSRLDSLTRIDNHTRFFQAAAEMLKHAQTDEHALTLIIGDIDHFKRVNDRFGHMAGDRALRGVARALRSRCPDGARLGRVGGEEFAACLPDVGREAVDALLERWREALARIDYGGDDLPLTMSFGVARARPGESLASLRLRADEALYRAKDDGRDRIVFADAQ